MIESLTRFRFREAYIGKVIIINLLFALWYITGNSAFNLLFLFVLGVFAIVNTSLGDFYLFSGMIPFLKLVTYQGVTVLFIFQFVAILKLIYERKRITTTAIALLASVSVLYTEFVFDFSYLSIGEFLYTICNFLYFICFLNCFEIKKIEVKKLLSVIVITSSICLLLVAVVANKNGMSLASYANATENYIRLGSETTNLIGAMGIPTYAGIVLSCVYVLFVKYKLSFLEMLFCAVVSAYSVVLGLLSVSRGFIVCLGVLAALIIANILFSKERKKSAIIVLIMMTIMLIIYYKNSDIVTNVILKLQSRMNGVNVSANDDRSSIWKDCVFYLGNHPTALLFGRGVNNYVGLGAEEGYRFSMSAHNLLLDGLMAWGIIGFGSLILAIISFFKRRVMVQTQKVDFTYIIPFCVWFALRMIGGAFTSFAMYIMILCFVIIAGANENIKDDVL